MYSNKRHIKELVDILYQKGVRRIVLSPGSRNAPITLSLARYEGIESYIIVDERSAAFFAMGLSLQTNEAVGLVCTSGTATLNYAPAIAEAYYQNIPLIVITADRASEWIDQADGQAIRQYRIYDNYVKKSFSLPQEATDATGLWYSNRIVSEAVNTACSPPRRPVHINVPLREPLYGLQEYPDELPKHIVLHQTQQYLSETLLQRLANVWNSATRILIVAGQMNRNEKLSAQIDFLVSTFNNVAVVAETMANINTDKVLFAIDKLLASFSEHDKERFRPHLVINIGTNLVTRKLKAYIRKYKPDNCWNVDASAEHVDIFQCLTDIIPLPPDVFFEQIIPLLKKNEAGYNNRWRSRAADVHNQMLQFYDQLPYCDLSVYRTMLQTLPQHTALHWGNSTPVRYAQLFNQENYVNFATVLHYSNRGTSGIDGCVSTAAGFAVHHNGITLCIVGDLSFVYDSNALWNKYLSGNFKIVVINNSGGDIFRFIEGASEVPDRETFFTTPQNVSLEELTKSFGIKYYKAQNLHEVQHNLIELYNNNQCSLLEIVTPSELNTRMLKQYFSYFNR